MGWILVFLLFFSQHLSAQTFLDPQGPLFFGRHSTKPVTALDRGSIRVISFNLAFSKNLDALASLLSKELGGADIYLLQEVVGSLEGQWNSAEELAKRLGLNYVFIPSQIHPKLRQMYGSAILSPWPLDEFQKIMLPGKHLRHRTQRAAVGASVRMGKTNIRAYSVHLENLLADTVSLYEASRRRQVQHLIANIPDDESPVVIGGDFNNINPTGTYFILWSFWQAGFEHATGWGRTKTPFPLAIDHIYVRKLRSIRYGQVSKKSASDHHAVWADLEF